MAGADLMKEGLRLPSKCRTPFKSGYKPEMDDTAESKADGLQWYQELIGQLSLVEYIFYSKSHYCHSILHFQEKDILNKFYIFLVFSKRIRNYEFYLTALNQKWMRDGLRNRNGLIIIVMLKKKYPLICQRRGDFQLHYPCS